MSTRIESINFADLMNNSITPFNPVSDTLFFEAEFKAKNLVFKDLNGNLSIIYIDPLHPDQKPISITLSGVTLSDLTDSQFIFQHDSQGRVIFTPDSNGYLVGGENDLIVGISDNNYIIAGQGDIIDSGTGTNTFIFDQYSTINTIVQNNSIGGPNNLLDTIQIDASVSDITDIYQSQSGADLIICYGNQQQITIGNFYTNFNQIDQIQFADGSTWYANDIQNTNYIFDTSNRNLTLSGIDSPNYISAGSGSDTLIGGSGNDTLIAGSGSDTLDGGDGNNTYVYSPSSLVANQTIAQTTENLSHGEGNDVILFNNINFT